MAKKLTEVYEKNTSSEEAKPEVKQTFVSGHWRTYGGEKKVKPEKNVEQKKIKEAKKSSASKGLGDQKAPLRSMSILTARIAKNTAVLPDMAKDINTMRNNLDKFLGAAGSDGDGFGLLDLLGLGDLIPDRERKGRRGKRKGQVGKQKPRIGRRGIILGALGVGAAGAAGYAASEAYSEKTAESPERKKERADKEAKERERIAAAVAATPQPATTGEFDTGERPAEQDAVAQAAAQRTIEQVPPPPTITPVTPTPIEEAAPAKVETVKPIRLPEVPKPVVTPQPEEPSVPKNVIRDEEGNALQSGSGGYVVSDRPITATPVPVPARPTTAPPTPSPAPAPTPTAPERRPSAVRNQTAVKNRHLKEAVEDKEFMSGIDALAKKYNSTREDMLAFMMNESGLNPAAHNPNGGASGLIQIMPSTLESMKKQGKYNSVKNLTSVEDIRNLSRVQQLPLIDDYFQAQGLSGTKGKTDLGTLYTTVFLPIFKYSPENTVMGVNAGQLAPDGTTPEKLIAKGLSMKAVYMANWGFDPGARVTEWLDAKKTKPAKIEGGKGYFTKGDVSKKAAKFNPEVQLALNSTGTMVASASTQNAATRTEAARPQVIASAPAAASGSTSISAPSSTSGRPRVDHTQALVQRQTSGA